MTTDPLYRGMLTYPTAYMAHSHIEKTMPPWRSCFKGDNICNFTPPRVARYIPGFIPCNSASNSSVWVLPCRQKALSIQEAGFELVVCAAGWIEEVGTCGCGL